MRNKLLLIIDAQNDFINNNTKDTMLKIEDELLNNKNLFENNYEMYVLKE